MMGGIGWRVGCRSDGRIDSAEAKERRTLLLAPNQKFLIYILFLRLIGTSHSLLLLNTFGHLRQEDSTLHPTHM